MLYIVPKNSPSEEPIIDELTMKMAASLRRATLPHRHSLGFHTCVCGAQSDSTDFILPNGLRTNSLCVHYLAYHRAEIEAGELWAVEGLTDGSEYPTSDELHRWTPLRDRHGHQVRATPEIGRRRERYEAASASGCARPDWIERTLVTVDVTGMWHGTSAFGRSTTELLLDLKQEGPKVTGHMYGQGFAASVTRDSGPIAGTVAGDAGDVFSFRQTNGPLTGELTVRGDEMTGQISVSSLPTPIVLRRVESSSRPDSPKP